MAVNTLIAFATILLIIVVSESGQNEQNKPGPLYKLCGDDFLHAFDKCCNHDLATCRSSVVSSSEGVVEALDKRGHPMIPSRVAKNFIRSLRKRGWGETSGPVLNHAVEECCNEGCSIDEIREYPCF
ncbi:uncharacterized protein LOC114521180 [Dendronephthya gigantea]|uniref:uncharacterized protein LOC114521180 n=1 Tax=Dendronephthya gigantea TaxID=151771 RepID=UPI00106CA5AA|nr:uncharacterized protein LOC114521180 [Dendronephthya gigantea]XP_028397398.1 uncharacterized protein LOC114521180 [Dendronephthya gigantea]XP_028397399.1 uncharacterized protein LOC114521180 [Dendronephthya gigantea]